MTIKSNQKSVTRLDVLHFNGQKERDIGTETAYKGRERKDRKGET